MNQTQRSAFGAYAENLAADYLIQRGYTILDRNYRRKWGELDLVAQRDNTIIFVEVKANRAQAHGFEPELRADRSKQEKIVRTARTYLLERQFMDRQWQVDIISVTINRALLTAAIKHFKNIDI